MKTASAAALSAPPLAAAAREGRGPAGPHRHVTDPWGCVAPAVALWWRRK